mmetsp:Transcript_97526/g.264832  ORF Transcript_97526/g.264832 Transcript_97526/m.264832 type:complete len:422 (+) Transcript_97526:67-1332(+)
MPVISKTILAFAALFACARVGVIGRRMVTDKGMAQGNESDKWLFNERVEFGESVQPNFANLREFHGLSLEDVLSEFDCFSDGSSTNCGGDGSGAAGLSGASFMLSSSKRFFAKTVDLHESPFLEKMLSDYVSYMISNPGSLMSVILTAFRLNRWKPCIYNNCWLVMNNALGKRFHKTSMGGKFDLKGVFERRDKQERGAAKLPWDEPDGLEEQFAEKGIFLSPARGHNLLEQLRNDTKFLAEQHLMDYSLLVQLEELGECDDDALAVICRNVESGEASTGADAAKNQCPLEHALAGRKPADSGLPTWTERSLFIDHSGYAVGVRGNVIYSYSIGLIDFIASYHLYQIGGWVQHYLEGKDLRTAELVEPWTYRERFLSYVGDKVISQGIPEGRQVRDPTCECADFHGRQNSRTPVPCTVAVA